MKGKTPPIVPKKNPKLKTTNQVQQLDENIIHIAHLIPREDPISVRPSEPKSLADFINNLNINGQFQESASRHEPKVIKYEDIMKPIPMAMPKRILHQNYQNHNTVEQVQLKRKPVPPPKPHSLISKSTTLDPIVSKGGHMMIPLPGLVNRHTTVAFNSKSKSSPPKENSTSEPTKLRHLNKSRSRGPSRRRPQSSSSVIVESRQNQCCKKGKGPSLKPKPSHLRSQISV